MKILIVWKNDYPWDVRLEKISLSLTSFGHEVHILARNVRRDKCHEIINGVHVHRLRAFSNNGFINSVLTQPAFYNPIWAKAIEGICNQYSINLMIARDLPPLLVSIITSKKIGIPIIFDMAEDYPAMWQDVLRGQWYKPWLYLLKNPIIGRYLEEYCTKRVNHIFVVVKESKDRLISSGISSEKISIISNTPDIDKYERFTINKKRSGDARIVLLYQGYVNKTRGLDTVIRAMPKLIRSYPNLFFEVAGDGNYINELKGLSQKLSVEKNIIFLGWVDASKIPKLIMNSNICVIPHMKTKHKDSTIPNKLFDYMIGGKPVIVTNAKPLQRIVHEENCGVVFMSNNSVDFADSLRTLLENQALQDKLGSNGHKSAMVKYNWSKDASVLKAIIEEVL